MKEKFLIFWLLNFLFFKFAYAEELSIDIGAMIIGGLVVGSITVLCGYLYALYANKKWDLPMRDTPDISVEELKGYSEKTAEELPSLGMSLAPIILPILLITGNTFLNVIYGSEASLTPFQQTTLDFFTAIGNSNMALLVSALLAMYLLYSRLQDMDKFRKFMSDALLSAGLIVLITSAGGAFGQILQQTGIGSTIETLANSYQTAILPLAFVITAVVRSAQGSATVAMITAIGVMSGFGDANLAFHPVYLALVIGCGSKIFAWMNDSGFWIITKMSGMKEEESIKFFSYLLAVMGVSGLIAVMILANLFPFV